MIYYFSATGNSRWIAEQLASITDDIALDIMDPSTPKSINDQILGLVFPVYAWGPPDIVLDFIKRLEGKPSFTFAVCTCGDEAGHTMKKLSRVLKLDSTYSISMPNNYVLGSDLEEDKVIRAKIIKAKEGLQSIGLEIVNRKPVNKVNLGKLPWLKSNLVNFGFNNFARSTKPFYATDGCSSCQKCVKVCPAETITMIKGKPHWGKRCFQCTACINTCPEEAIQYGKSTLNRKRYQLEKYI